MTHSTQSLYASLILRQEQLSHEIATEFIKKIYDYEIIDEIYFVGGDPTGILGYRHEFWILSDMLETLDNDYDRSDVWNYYEYNTEYAEEGYRLTLSAFIGFFKGYTGDVAILYDEYKAMREKNRLYWESPEGKKKEEELTKPILDKYLEDIKTLS